MFFPNSNLDKAISPFSADSLSVYSLTTTLKLVEGFTTGLGGGVFTTVSLGGGGGV